MVRRAAHDPEHTPPPLPLRPRLVAHHPARRTPLYRWSSADRYVQCRDKLWESPSAEEIDPAKVERCADPNCGNTCQKNHCQKVTRGFGAALRSSAQFSDGFSASS